jgi:hypothetical protein
MAQMRSVQAERDAEAARVRLEQTLDEIRGRLTPGQMLDEALDYVRDGSGGEFVRNLGRQVRGNPLPVTLVGAGLAWLMASSRRGAVPPARTDYRNVAERFAASESDLAEETESLSARTSQAAASARDSVSSAYHDVTESVSVSADRLQQGMSGAAGRASHMSRQTAQNVNRLFHDQPLILGALGLALGAALGSAFPATRTENRMAGEASDALKQQAGEALDAEAEKAMNVASRAYDEGQRAAAQEGLLAPEGGDSGER